MKRAQKENGDSNPGTPSSSTTATVARVNNRLNLFDCMVECSDLLNNVEGDGDVSKQDVIDSMRARIAVMITKTLTTDGGFGIIGAGGGFSGWQVETPHALFPTSG